MPISREYRTLVYQRAKGARDTRAFGTVFDVNRVGAEWLNHSLDPLAVNDKDPRVIFGENTCKKPYAASPLNISAMRSCTPMPANGFRAGLVPFTAVSMGPRSIGDNGCGGPSDLQRGWIVFEWSCELPSILEHIAIL